MAIDIIEHNGSTYQIIPQSDEYGIQIGICKNGNKIADYTAGATMEVVMDFDFQLGERLLPVLADLVIGEIKQGKFDKI